MYINITKLHFSEVRNIASTNSLIENKYDKSLIGCTNDGGEKYGVYSEEKLLLLLYMEILSEYKEDPNSNCLDHDENLSQAKQRFNEINEGLLQAYWYGVPYSIICQDSEYLENRLPDQTINTCDQFRFTPINYDYPHKRWL